MFTENQIKETHSKVKSGADFPAYIQDLKLLGVTHYEVFVKDRRAVYYGANDYKVIISIVDEILHVAEKPNELHFKSDLKSHQNGKTDYRTFCKDCAKSGIEKWVVFMDEMTCTYFDRTGNKILVEQIPQ
jgi:uncharacterized protein YbcV (DUF1398 family)